MKIFPSYSTEAACRANQVVKSQVVNRTPSPLKNFNIQPTLQFFKFFYMYHYFVKVSSSQKLSFFSQNILFAQLNKVLKESIFSSFKPNSGRISS